MSTRYEVQRRVADPNNEDPDWTQVSIPNTLSTARDHARKDCRRGPGTVTRVLVNGEEVARYQYSNRTRSRAEKVKVWS